jgi:L-rhamnose isomerase
MDQKIKERYEEAKKAYAAYGVDTDEVLKRFAEIPVSLQCWAGDDIKGFENLGNVASENVVTGAYPYAARTGAELRGDIEEAFRFSPLKKKVNLHSMYAEHHSPRNDLKPEDFREWIDWAVKKGYGLDFNTSFFTHPMMKNGQSVTSDDKKVRDYWIKAGLDSRKIAVAMGKATGMRCYNNFWFPDGMKDVCIDRAHYRKLLEESLDQMFKVPYTKAESRFACDTVEGKWFGIGTENFVAGSHEFYIGYAIKNHIGLTLDLGHFRPTEDVSDKVSAIAPFIDGLQLHVSRGIHWDSDHIVIEDDCLNNMMLELKRGGYFGKVAIALDYFDATVNRVYSWVIGLRATAKSILYALLEPTEMLKKAERAGDYSDRLLFVEDFHNLPYNAVWDYALASAGIPSGLAMEKELKAYEKNVQAKRK